MKVLKFGGTSMGSAARMGQVARIIEHENNCVVVCSAMAGVTDKLVEIVKLWKQSDFESANNLCKALYNHFENVCFELGQAELAFANYVSILAPAFNEIENALLQPWSSAGEKWILARGEIITTKVFNQYLNSIGIGSHFLNAFSFIQKNELGEPDIDDIAGKLKQVSVFTGRGRYLTQGFICLDYEGNADNLARGGSDYSATLIGAALGARTIEIWTDIDGLHNNDPRVVDGTRPVRELSFGEAAELAYFGAKILHPSCVWPAANKNIPVLLKNTLEPLARGTLIAQSNPGAGIRAIAAKDGISIVRIRSGRMLNAYGFLKKIFEIFEKFKTPIDVITTSEVAVSVTIDNDEFLQEICNALSPLGEVSYETNQSIVCVVGDVLAENQGYTVCIMEALRHLQVKMVSFGGSSNNLTVVVAASQKAHALVSLQSVLFGEAQPAYRQLINN